MLCYTTQIAITDRSVAHPAMPPSRHFIFMTVYPSGMLITPVQQGERTISHVKLISHFHLRGTVSHSLLHRVRGNRMLEACCFNYLNEFRAHALTKYAGQPQPQPQPQPRQPQQPQQQEQSQQQGPPQPQLRELPSAPQAAAAAADADACRQDAAAALIHAATASR